MNKKIMGFLIVVLMALSVVPVALPAVSANVSEPISDIAVGELPSMHKTGLIWVPLEKYEKVTGIRFPTINARAFHQALISAPFYPGRTLQENNVALDELPSAVENTLYLPPVGNQGYVGSCNAWSSTYYVWTYMLNWWRNHPHPDTPDVIMNPTFTYNLINGGEDSGSNMWDAMNLISTIGAVPLDAFPLYIYGPYGDPENYAWVWPNLTHWMMAPYNRGTEDMYWWQYIDGLGGTPNLYKIPGQWYILYLDNDTQWDYFKHLLASGYVVQFAYPVNLVFYVVTTFQDADEFLSWLDRLANRTENQTFINYVKEHFTENQTFIWQAKYYFTPNTVTNAMVEWTFNTWWKVWETYYNLMYNRTAPFVFGGHAVTIVGYDDNVMTPDGYGVVKIVNSWGPDWGDNGYFYMSYDALRFGMYYYNSLQMAFVYVPKAAEYKPKVMAIVGIKHPLRGEVIDGVINFNDWSIVAHAGIPIGVSIDNKTIWEHNFLDFWANYIGLLSEFPQAHPFPDSPMAFDVSNALDALNSYILQSNTIPYYLDFYLNVSDKIPDNITGTIYNFTLMVPTPNGPYYVSSNITNVTIPDGGWIVKDIKVPLAQYALITPANGTSVNYGNFSVDVVTLAAPESAVLVIANKTYNLTTENGGYYFYATAIAQKLKLPAGTYNYTVMLNFGTNRTLTLPTRTITIKGPSVQILSPEAKIYNSTSIPFKVKITSDGLNITDITALLNDRPIKIAYNSTSALYEAHLNLTDGVYTFTVKVSDEFNNTGIATVQFVVSSNANVKTVSNITVGIVNSNVSNITVQNNILNATVQVNGKNITVEVPIVNNIPAVIVNATAIKNVAEGEENVTLVAGWNSTVNNIKAELKVVKTENGKKLVAITFRADVKLGENGVAVVALRDTNITKIRVIKEDGSVIYLTTNKSNRIGYYYKENGIVFVVLKEDPTIEADGYTEVSVKQNRGVSVTVLNFLYYMYYKRENATFMELHQKAINLTVDKLTLSMAIHYMKLAQEEYEKALELSGGNIFSKLGDPRLLGPLRKAYLNIKRAVEILEQAIKAKSS